jgi:amino acid permease
VVSVLLLSCVLLAAIMVLPYWKFSNVTYIPQGIKFVTSTTVMFPFALTTILFIQSLSPMVMSYRTKYADRQFAQKKAISTMRLALLILATIVLFYIIAFAGIISQNEAILAKNQNESVFMIIQKMNYSNPLINVLGIFINICAVLAAFLSIITGMREGVRGILLNLIRGISKDGAIVKSPVFEVIIGVIIVLMTWLSIVFQVPIYKLVPLCGPIFGIIGCLMPAFLVYKVPALYKYKGLTVYYIVYVGLILCISPLLMKAM